MSCPERPLIPTNILDEHCEKGCIHWFDVESEIGKYSSLKARPYIIVSRTCYSSDKVQTSPITDMIHKVEKITGKLKYPYHGALYKKENEFLEKDSVILLDQIITIGKDELCEEWYMGKVEDYKSLDMALLYQFDLFNTMKSETVRLISQIDMAYTKEFSRK